MDYLARESLIEKYLVVTTLRVMFTLKRKYKEYLKIQDPLKDSLAT